MVSAGAHSEFRLFISRPENYLSSHCTKKKGSLSTSFLGASGILSLCSSDFVDYEPVLIPLYKKKEVFRLPFWVPSGILSLCSSDFVDYEPVLIPLYKKKEVFRLPFWVPSGIRTHDIQNHNLTL